MQGSPRGSVVKNLPASAGDTGLIPGPERFHMLCNNQDHAPQLLSLCFRAWEPELLSPRAATTEAHDPKSPYSTREATTVRDQAPQPESGPHSSQLEKSPR